MAELNPALVPLSLYIHMPWCVRKCPYCDFNSHAVPNGELSLDLEEEYLQALVEDFKTQVDFAQGRRFIVYLLVGDTIADFSQRLSMVICPIQSVSAI